MDLPILDMLGYVVELIRQQGYGDEDRIREYLKSQGFSEDKIDDILERLREVEGEDSAFQEIKFAGNEP